MRAVQKNTNLHPFRRPKLLLKLRRSYLVQVPNNFLLYAAKCIRGLIQWPTARDGQINAAVNSFTEQVDGIEVLNRWFEVHA